MTTVAQEDLVNAISVDELSALGSSPTLSNLLMYVRDGSQATENGKHRKVALDVLRTLLQPVLKTVNSESLFGSGDIAITSGGSNTPDTAVQTSNFTFGEGGVGWNVPVNLSGGNIVGTLPASPTNGQIVRVYGCGIAGGSANRFSFNLNGRTLNGGTLGFGNLTSDCSQGSVAASLAAIGATLTASSVASWSANQINIADDDNPGEITFTIVAGTGGGTLTFVMSTFFLSVFRNGTNLGGVNSVTLVEGLNTVRIYRNATPSSSLDTFAATNVAVPTPSSWTDTANRNIGPSGYVELQYSSANSTWHVLQRTQLGL